MKFDHLATITRSVKNPGSDGWDFGDDPQGTTDIVIEKYPCKITESVQSYEVNTQGENYTGRCKMKGILTDKLQEGDLVDGKYKIVGQPRVVMNRMLLCYLVRIN